MQLALESLLCNTILSEGYTEDACLRQ